MNKRRSWNRHPVAFFLLTMALLASVFFTGPLSAAANSPFTDVESVEVERLASNGIVRGMTETTFSPSADVTRGQAAVMITRALDIQPVAGTGPFADVPATHFASGAIHAANQAGIISGGTDGRFRPDDTLSRGEMAAILNRAFTYESIRSLSFQDVSSRTYFQGDIHALANSGITSGYPDGTFGPNRTITRLEFSLMLARTLYPEFRPPVSIPDSDVDSVTAEAAKVTATSLNIRPTPSTAQEPIGRLVNGAVVDVLSVNSGWAEIRAGSTTGYVSTRYLDFDVSESDLNAPPPVVQPPPTIAPTPPATGQVQGIVVRTPTLNIRPTASTNQNPVGVLREGDVVTILGTSGTWVNISHGSTRGYVSSSYLTEYNTRHNGALAGKTIVVDPGHGGTDSGAAAFGLQEKHIVLDMSLRLEAKLKAAGANVIMTRRTDVYPTLEQRVALANRSGADIFISVHTNGFVPEANGTETFYNTTYWAGNSKKLADAMQKHMLRELGLRNRGVKTAGFYVIRHTTMPSVLVEPAFTTNAREADLLRTAKFREDTARAMYQATLEYFGVQ